MAVQSDTSSISYTGNNSTVTSYAVPFVFLENGHLQAFSKATATSVGTAVTLTNHTGAGDPNGGTVRTAVAIPATSTLTISRTVPETQTTTYQEGGDFPAASHERALDKLTFLAQQNKRLNERSFRVTENSGAKNEVVAVPNTLLGLDENNQPKALTLGEVKSYLALTGNTLSVPAGIKTFADSGERALAVPDFDGQIASQRDTGRIYLATGSAAGDWTLVDEDLSLADFASGFFTADATGRGKFEGEFVNSALIEAGAVITPAINDAAVTTAKIADSNVTTAKLAATVQQLLVPAGAVLAFAMNSAPSGWLAADGNAISRSVYADLFAAIGTTYGAGDGSTTFVLPDLRGVFVRGSGSQLIGTDVYSGAFGQKQNDTLKSHSHTFADAGVFGTPAATGTPSVVVASQATFNKTTSNTGDAETRPANIALLYCIKF
jgi:microcystin-dependent protein